MAALPPYIPAKDAELNDWSDNFATLIEADPGTFGLASGDAAAITAVVDPWAAAYATAISPSTRTPATVAAKDAARITMLATVRPYAQTISLNAGVTTESKIAVGVNPRTSTPTPVTTPTTTPDLSIVSAPPLQHIIRYRDSMASPSVKSKPYGVTSLQLFASASATVITDPATLAFVGNYSKSPLIVAWDSSDKGKTAYFAARWVTRTGLVGPWSTVVSYTIAG